MRNIWGTLALLLVAGLAVTPAQAQDGGYKPGKVGSGPRVRSFGKVGGGTTGRTTKVGDNRAHTNVYKDMKGQIGALKTQVKDLKAGGGSSSSGGDGGGAARTGRIMIMGDAPQPPSWRQRVAEAKAELPVRDKRALARILERDDSVNAFAALSLEKEGKVRYPTSVLAKTMNGTSHGIVARGAALLLARRKGKEVDEALVEHIRRRRPADAMAVEILMTRGSKLGRDELRERASHATSKDRAGLLSIRALAFHPGPDVTLMLNRLANDWSPEVKKAAKDALALRGKAGLGVKTAFKPAPVGAIPGQVATVKEPSQKNVPEEFRGVGRQRR